jgi:two-component system, cell cycle response regulator DivK
MSKTLALVIDDNLLNISVIVQLLKMEGIESISFQDTVSLLDKLASLNGVDVVFLDMEMPHHDGYEVFKALKSRPEFARVPIIAYSVHISEVEAVQEHGFNGFLGKPIDAERFPSQVEQILNGKSVWYIP